jgi:hypothetical protein
MKMLNEETLIELLTLTHTVKAYDCYGYILNLLVEKGICKGFEAVLPTLKCDRLVRK